MSNYIQLSITRISQVYAIHVKWLIPSIASCPQKQIQFKKYAEYWFKKQVTFLELQGVVWTSSYFKEVRAITIRFLAKNPTLVTKRFISIDKQGLPRVLGPLKVLALSEDETDHRFLLTLLRSSKSFVAAPIPNFGAITEPSGYGGTLVPEEVLANFFNGLQIRKGSLKHNWLKYHLSTKSSPNQGPATYDAIRELVSVMKPRTGPFGSLAEAIWTIAGNRLKSNMLTLMKLDKVRSLPQVELRKLTAIQDKEGKTRLVAILDYWSQTCLLPLHDSLLSILRGIKQDCTFDQSNFIRDLPRRKYFACYDLKDATDRLPLPIQQQILSFLTSQDVAAAWGYILVYLGYTYNGDVKVPHSRKTQSRKLTDIKYSIGQPMGAYSSWAMFSLTHHILVQWAAKRAGFGAFADYSLLGDDLVIYSKSVAEEYRKLMLELGVEISDVKSLTSSSMMEFASRHFRGGVEVTGFSTSGLLDQSSVPEIVEFFRNQVTKGWCILGLNATRHLLSLLKVLIKTAPKKERWFSALRKVKPDFVELVWTFPVRELASAGLVNESCKAVRALTCFSKGAEILRGALLEEMLESLNRDIEKVTSLQVEWAVSVSEYALDLFQSSSDDELPFIPNIIPLLGAWHELKSLLRDRVNDLQSYLLEEEELFDDLSWVASYPVLYTLPDVNRAMRKRRSVLILQSNYALLDRAYKRAFWSKELILESGL